MRVNLEKKIAKVALEIEAAERDLYAKKAVLLAYQSLLKEIGEEGDSPAPASAPTTRSSPMGKGDLRPGSGAYRAKQAILKAGHPLHIGDILQAIGKANNKANRISLSGSLAAYVRKGEQFTKTGPNIFGVLGMSAANASLVQDSLPMASLTQ